MDNPNRISTTSGPPYDNLPQYYPPAGGQPQYPQPGGYGYPGHPFANYPPPPQQQQQHQQQVVVVNNSQPVYSRPPPVNLCGAIALSCVVFWCCGWLLGLIAFILAMIGQSSASAGDNTSAIQLRNASYGLSIAGIVVGVIIIAVVGGVVGSAAKTTTYNTCYNYSYGYYYRC